MDLLGGGQFGTAVRRDPLEEELDDIDEDETLTERLWGLTEMFPQPINNAVGKIAEYSWSGVCIGFKYSRMGLWLASTTALVAFLPYIIEKEMADLEQKTLEQHKRMLLGPQSVNSAQKGGLGMGPVMGLAPGAK